MNKPTIPEVLLRFRSYYERNRAWGSLHVVLDDGNVADDHVRSCEQYAKENGDTEGATLAAILLTMSKTQRLKLPNAVDAAERAAHNTGEPPAAADR